jgi:CAAX prenyl protease-like protein
MKQSIARLFGDSPTLPRVVPFLIFLGLTFAQGSFGEASRYWVYLAKTLIGAVLVWAVWDLVKEARWAFSWEAGAVGVGVFVVWVGLDGFYPSLNDLLAKVGIGKGTDPEKPDLPWNPHAQFGQGSGLAWLFIVTRIVGSTLVVPVLEETFYRSFLYRYFASPKWQELALNVWKPSAFFITAAVFGFAHHEWLAGILCAMGYQWLVLRKGRLGDAMTAHAITNFLLGVWIVWKGAWKFW